MKVRANGIDIEVEDTGADGRQSDRPVVMLVMGLGMQLIAWPPMLVQALVDAGFRVIRHDNRDIGLSQHFDHLGEPNLIWETLKVRFRLRPRAPYQLHDMAQDALGVLDALGIARAHVIGVSMGGMIAQRMALAAPERCLSLTSVMSSSGARGLPEARPPVVRALLARPASSDMDAIVAHYMRLFRVIGSPGFPVEDQVLRDRIVHGIERSYHPAGSTRQLVAIAADTGHRARALGSVRVPTLVVHGKDDPLVPYACGVDTARRIPGARLVGIGGMGHDLAPGVVERILQPLLPHLRTV